MTLDTVEGLSELQHGVLLQQQLQSGWHCRTQTGVSDPDEEWNQQTESIRPYQTHHQNMVGGLYYTVASRNVGSMRLKMSSSPPILPNDLTRISELGLSE